MPSPSDFPEKVKKVTLYRAAAMNGPERRTGPWDTSWAAVASLVEEVQEEEFFSASLVEELVEELTEVGRWLAAEDGPASVLQSIESVLVRAKVATE